MILTFTFFTGEGTYHGLFWPTPSLYSVALFLIVLKGIFSKKGKLFLFSIIILPFFLFMHPLSLVALAFLPFYYFFSCVFSPYQEKVSEKEYLCLFF